jgi:hypothetical protein
VVHGLDFVDTIHSDRERSVADRDLAKLFAASGVAASRVVFRLERSSYTLAGLASGMRSNGIDSLIRSRTTRG